MSTRRNIFYLSLAFLLLVLVGIPTKSQFFTQAGNGLIAGRNVNMVSGTQLPLGDPWLQRQNEPSIAVSSRNPMHLFAAANDYRTIDMPDDYSLPGIPGASAVRDSWIGVFESFDGGESSVTMLLPGFPQDTSAEGVASPIHGFDTACDPIVRAGARGLFYLSGIAFNRNQQQGVVFVSRYVDINNRESVQEEVDPGSGYKRYVGPIQYMDTKAIDRDTQRRFIDMPNMAVDIPRGGAAYGNVYVAYTVFLGDTTRITRSRILLVRSSDGGVTWSWPRILSEFQYLVQRPVIVIDPSDSTGKTIYIVFRRFAFLNKPDGIAFVKSVNGGISFSGPKDIATLPYPFDQGTTESSFRTNSYPTMAIDGNGIVYVAWAQRYGLDGTPNPDGQARIVISYSQNRGLTWSQPCIVDSYQGDGHQFMPTMTCGGGKLRLAWYDQRDDDSLQHPNPKFIEDAYPHRHTIDVRAIEGTPGAPPAFQSSILVSRYLYFMLLDENGERKPFDNGSLVMQGEYNFINFPLFHLGTKPFHGDYIEIVSSPQILPPPASPSNSWVFNTSAAQPTTCPVIWTDTRDVWPPAGNIWGDWTIYNPPTSTQDGDFSQQNPCSNEDHTGMKNQNIYTANLNYGVVVGSPGNTKQLDIERTFVISVRNSTELTKELSLDLFPSSGVPASFEQFSSQSSLAITVEPFSSVTATVYAGPSGSNNGFGSIRVDVTEGGTLVGRIFLNPDSTNSPILDPGGNPLSSEFHNPLMSNPKIWKYYVGNQDEPNAIFLSPRAQNPRAQNSGYVNPRAQNEGILNPRAQNPRAQNPRAQNENVVNNEMYNPRAQNPRAQNAALTDMTWTVTNDGNTTSAYSFDIVSNDADYINEEVFDKDLLIAQVLVYKMHTVPIDQKCALLQTHADELIVNVTNPRAQNPRAQNYGETSRDFTTLGRNATTQDDPEMPPDITFYLAPGEEAEVVLRVYDPIADDEFSIDDVIVDDIAGETEAEAANTGDTIPVIVTQPDLPWESTSQLTEIGVSHASLSFEAVLGEDPGEQTFSVWNSGTGTLEYTISDDAAWLGVSPSSGTSDDQYDEVSHTVSVGIVGLEPGTYPGTITIADPYATNNPARVPVTLTLYAVAPLRASSSAVPISGAIPLTVDFTGSATGGTPPYSYSWDFGDSGSSAVQNPSHTYSSAGTFNAVLTVTDSASNVDASDPIVISANAGMASKLVFTQSPNGGVGGAIWTTQPIVKVQDALGNVVTSDDSTVVTLAISNNPGSGSLSGPFSMTVTDGVAAFNDLSIDKGGWGYTLEATSGLLTVATSETFNIEGFSSTGSMNAGRESHKATYLVNDKVLIAGGAKAPFANSAEIYDPSTGSFTNLGNVMTAGPHVDTATVLPNNKVLITGMVGLTNSAEIFDPGDNSFSATGSMNHDRGPGHGATLLQDGRVLITGGADISRGNTAEIYDPVSGIFTLVADTMGDDERNSHTSTLLPNGKVLIAGGKNSITIPPIVYDDAYLYDPATEEFTLIGNMPGGPRFGHTATLLDDGTVLIAGGSLGGIPATPLSTALIYDPYDGSNGSFTLLATNMNGAHFGHQAALLRDGKVLLTGDTAEIYDPITQQFHVTGPLAQSRQGSAAVILDDGRILVTGGSGFTTGAEIWNPNEPFPTHVISGTITHDAAGVVGVLLIGLPGHPMTNGGGYYEGLVLDGESPTVTPTKPGYPFNPSSRSYINVTADMSGQDYTTTGLYTYTINGTITVGGSGLEGVVMNGLPGNPPTDSYGSYTATVTFGWSGTVTPTLAHYHFTPSSQSYSNVASNQTTNYTAQITQYQLNVIKAGDGAGTVTSADGGINCGGDCQQNYDYGIVVQLTAAWAPGSLFTGWSGDVPAGHESDNPVMVTIDGNKNVTATFTAAAPLVITTVAVPDGIKNTAYDTTLQSAGGVPPVTWSIISGSLPTGLVLNPGTGQISGTPTVSGYFSFIVQATDTSLQMVSQAFSMTVADWVARYNGPIDSYDTALAIVFDSSGNSYVTGLSKGSGANYNATTIKYNSAGSEQWVARYNDPIIGSSGGRAIAVDALGYVYVTGTSHGLETENDVLTIKYDNSGSEQWARTYDGPVHFQEAGEAIAVDASGNVYVTGYSQGVGEDSDIVTIKYDGSGTAQWVARFDGLVINGGAGARAIAIDSSGNVYVTGDSAASDGSIDCVTIKYNSAGAEQWVARYTSLIPELDSGEAIALDASGNVYVAGWSGQTGPWHDYITIKYNSAGAQQWVSTYNGPGNRDDEAHALAVDASGNVYVTGNSDGGGTALDYATVKYNSSGVEQWVARYNGAVDGEDSARSIAVNPLGDVYVTGYSYGSPTASDYATVKYNSAGVLQWAARYTGPGDDVDKSNDTAIDPLGNIEVTGWSVGTGTINDYATVRYVQSFPDTLIITTEALDIGYVGMPYAKALWAFGGSGSRTWSITGGSLPPGMGFIGGLGRIVGTPTTPGTYNFTVQVQDDSLIADKPLSITISQIVGPPAKLAFSQQPSNAAVGATISPPVTVQIQDQWGNLVTTATNTVVLSLRNAPGATLSGTPSKAAAGGVATFDDLTVDTAGTGYQLRANSGSLTEVDSTLFNILSVTPLQATSSAAPTSGPVPLTVNFTGSATGGVPPYSYAWTFGDGGTSAVQNPSHTYSGVGTFNAVLTVTDSATNSDPADPIIISPTGGSAGKIELAGPEKVGAGFISEAFTVTSQDAGGNPVNVLQNTVFNLSSNTTGTKVFYSDPEGTTPITQVTILSGQSSTSFYYKDDTVGVPNVTATWTSGGSDLGSDTHQITVWAVVGEIAFQSDRDGDMDIYIMNVDGSGQTNLMDNSSYDYSPNWSPDGGKIAFTSNRDGNQEVYVMNADGSWQTNLTHNSANDYVDCWSPDGSKILFTTFRDGNWEIYVMNADGSGQTNLTNSPTTGDQSASWSSDGSKIVYTRARDGLNEIYVMNADGTNQTMLTNGQKDYGPNWSPDGSKILFYSLRDGQEEIYVIDADGTDLTRLTDHLARDQYCCWSPDGSKIAFTSERESSNYQIYVMDANGSNITRLTNNSAEDSQPNWCVHE
jgi:uncharacterized delta-60 repeat protein